MVMGSFRLLIETALRNFASARYFTLLCITFFILMFAVQEGEGSTCQVDECTQPYMRSTRHLKAALHKNPTENLSKKRCRVLKRLHRCLYRHRRSCHGNLLYHSLKPISDNQLQEANCSRKSGRTPSGTKRGTLTTPRPKANWTLSAITTPSTKRTLNSACVYSGSSNYKHCGMFGDPHLRTFSDVFNTCKVKGARVLIDNDYLMVMVTNVPVEKGSSATATTKITVQFHPSEACAVSTMFVAKSGQLSGAFVDGSPVAESLEVVEIEPRERIEIHAHHIGTTIIIRQVGRYLTFAIRMPEEFILSRKTQLCVHGCPSADQLFPEQVKSDNVPGPSAPSGDPATNRVTNSPNNPLTPNVYVTPESKKQGNASPYFTEIEARVSCKRILLGLPAVKEKENLSESTNATKPREKRKNMQAARRLKPDLIHSSFKQLRGVEESNTKRPQTKKGKRHRGLDRTGTSRERSHRRQKRAFDDQRKQFPKSRRETKKCADKRRETTNFYFDSCVFDLITTGDVEFAKAAKAALDDVRRTHALTYDAPSSSVHVITRWHPDQENDPDCDRSSEGDTRDGGGGAQGSRSSYLLVILCTIFTCFYLNFLSISAFDDVTVNLLKQKNETRARAFHIKANLIASRTS